MLPKFLITIGVCVVVLGLLGVPIGIYSSFASMKNSEIEGISSVEMGITIALWGSISSIAGGILFTIGLILLYKRKRKSLS